MHNESRGGEEGDTITQWIVSQTVLLKGRRELVLSSEKMSLFRAVGLCSLLILLSLS